jgi:tripartite motif-containing protein 71
MFVRLSLVIGCMVAIASTAAAATGPVTPTVVLAWGTFGSAPAQFQSPTGVATDGLGNVYVADQSNHRVQKFNRLGSFLLAWGSYGSGSGQFNQPSGVAVDLAGNVYVSDAGNNRIQKFTSSGVPIGQWGSGGGGPGQFNLPYGVATDAAGSVYVADAYNNRIQKFTSSGVYLTQWGAYGAGGGQFNTPTGVATDATGNVYVADFYNNRIQKFRASGAYVTQWGSTGNGAGQFQNPVGLCTDALGNVYVADTNNSRIQKFSAAGTHLTSWGTPGIANGQFQTPFAVAADAAGNIYVADLGNQRLQKFSGAGVALSDAPPAFLLKWGSSGSGNGQFNPSFSVATDVHGNVYVADTNNHRIQKFNSTGGYLAQFGTLGSGAGQFNHPTGVAAYTDPDGYNFVYVVDQDNSRVQKLGSDGGYVVQWGSPGTGGDQFDHPTSVAVDDSGNVYVSDSNNHRIQKFSTWGLYITQWGAHGTGNGQFGYPMGVAIDRAGNVYVADHDNDRVQKFNSTGGYLTQWGSFGSGNGQFRRPFSVATDGIGAVYVADNLNSRVEKFTSSGDYLTQWGSFGSGDAQFTYANTVACDTAGNIYVADMGNRVQKFVNPAPIALVSDVRNDQGRQTQIRFLRSSADAPGVGVTIEGYEIYRRNDADLSWSYLMTAPAHGESEYNVVVPTLVDAMPSSLEYTAFKVRAVTSSPSVFYDSGAENGYSIDNLPPPPPASFMADYAEGATHLHWGASPASDFANFRLYRGASADFVPESDNLVAATPDNDYALVGAAGSYYKLSAVDVHGNESGFALVGPSQTSGAPAVSSFELALEGVRPNPARDGRMLVHFVLPSTAPARLELFDLAGRRVLERMVGLLGPGPHAVDLAVGHPLPAGIYLLRLTEDTHRLEARAVVLD